MKETKLRKPDIVIIHKKGCKVTFDKGETWKRVTFEEADWMVNKFSIPYYNGGTDFSIYQKEAV